MSDTFYPAGYVLTGKYEGKNIYKETRESFMIASGDHDNKIVTDSIFATNYRTLKSISRETVKCYEDVSSVHHGPNMSSVAKGAFWFGAAGALVGAAVSQSNTYDIALEFKDGDKFLIRITVAGYYQEFKRIFFDFPSITQSSIPAIPSGTDQKLQATPVSQAAPLLERAYMFLEDGDFAKADEYFEKVLDLDPKNATAYVGKLLVDLKITDQSKLSKLDSSSILTENPWFIKALKYGDEKLVSQLNKYTKSIKQRIKREYESTPQGMYEKAVKLFENAVTSDDFLRAATAFEKIPDYMDTHSYIEKCYDASIDAKYQEASTLMTDAKSEAEYKQAAELFKSIITHLDSRELAVKCDEKAAECCKNDIYCNAKSEAVKANIASLLKAIELFKSISGWKDADDQIAQCEAKLTELRKKEENERIERERKAEQERIQREKEAEEKRKRDQKKKKLIIVCTSVLAGLIALAIVISVISNIAKKATLQNSFDNGTFSAEFVKENYGTLYAEKFAYAVIEKEFEKCRKNNDAKKALYYIYELSETGFVFEWWSTSAAERPSIFFSYSYGQWLLDYARKNGKNIETQIEQKAYLDYYSYSIDGYSVTFEKNSSNNVCTINILTSSGWYDEIRVVDGAGDIFSANYCIE